MYDEMRGTLFPENDGLGLGTVLAYTQHIGVKDLPKYFFKSPRDSWEADKSSSSINTLGYSSFSLE